MTQFRLGVNNCFAVKRWPEWRARMIGRDWDLRLCQFTFDLSEPCGGGSPPDAHVKLIREAARAHQVSLHSTFTGLSAYSGNLLAYREPALLKS